MRNNVLAHTALLTLGALLLITIFMTNSNSPSAVAQNPPPEAPLRHVVLFKFKAETTKAQIDEIVAGFQALPRKIDGITAFEWGMDVSPEGLSEGFTHCFVVSFKDAQARDAYLPHQA